MNTNGLVLDALGDPTRRQIFDALRRGPRSVGELAGGLPVSRPAVSQHLRVLKDAGLVIDRKDGTRRLYRVDPDGLAGIRDVLRQLLGRGAGALRGGSAKGERMSTTVTEAIRKTVLVDFPPAEAFDSSPPRIASWWPTETHSYGGDEVTDVVFEPRVGGRVYEVTDEGEQDWGRVLEWSRRTDSCSSG